MSSDSGLILVGHDTFMSVCTTFGSTLPHLDVFAGPGRGEHVVQQYFTELPDYRSLGADAFSRSWDVPRLDGREPLVWVFPPSGQELRAINAVAEQEINAILVLPKFSDAVIWSAHVERKLGVRVAAPVLELPYKPGLFFTGLRAPKWLETRKFGLMAYHIKWGLYR